jgi:tetratricopeptide (TPR) repeat protein
MAIMSPVCEPMLQKANALHRQGDTEAAEPLYRAVLADQSGHAEANHSLGLLLAERGGHVESVRFFQAALRAQPRADQYWLSYANALLQTCHPREAQMVLVRAQQSVISGPTMDALIRKAQAALTSSAADLKVALGTAHLAQRRIADAIGEFRDAIAFAPDHAEAHFCLGSVLSESGHVAEGFAHYMTRAAIMHYGHPWPQDKPQRAHRTKHDCEKAQYLAERQRPPVHQLEDGARLAGPAVNPANVTAELVQRWHHSDPKMVVIEKCLTPSALDKLRGYCAGSTIWRRTYDAGYIGVTPEDGLACPLMAQIAEEIRSTYCAIIGDHAYRYLGAFKYDSELSTGTNTHADNSAVNVNLYIAPDEAKLDPDSGGMDIWNVSAPPGDEMRRYNSDETLTRNYLKGARLTRVPHRANRAVIFKSDLFHKTSDCNFREGYLNKRINVSLLFGHRPN